MEQKEQLAVNDFSRRYPAHASQLDLVVIGQPMHCSCTTPSLLSTCISGAFRRLCSGWRFKQARGMHSCMQRSQPLSLGLNKAVGPRLGLRIEGLMIQIRSPEKRPSSPKPQKYQIFSDSIFPERKDARTQILILTVSKPSFYTSGTSELSLCDLDG